MMTSLLLLLSAATYQQKIRSVEDEQTARTRFLLVSLKIGTVEGGRACTDGDVGS